MVNATQSQSWSGRLRIPQWRNFLPPPSEVDRDRDLPDVAGGGSRRPIGRVGQHLHASGESFGAIESLADWSTSCHSLSLVQTRTPTAGAEGIEKALVLNL